MKIYFYHGRTVDNKRFTVAGKFNDSDNVLNIGLSMCGKKDNFCRRIGRIIAEGRLTKGITKSNEFLYPKGFKAIRTIENDTSTFVTRARELDFLTAKELKSLFFNDI